jgi:hypothetical protein
MTPQIGALDDVKNFEKAFQKAFQERMRERLGETGYKPNQLNL